MRKTLLAAIAASVAFLAVAPAFAGDINAPAAAFTKAVTAAPTNCLTSASCSGLYVDFGVMGEGNDVNVLANGAGSAFSDGLGVFAGGGYQVWQGQLLAGIEASLGYEFANGGNTPGNGKFLGQEAVHLGYNFFPSSATSTTTPGQSPIGLIAPANLLAASTPYLIMGGIQRHGISEATIGAGIQTVIAAGWSTEIEYMNAPSQQGQPDDQVFMIKVLKHL
jgi:hypothetical protein